MFFIFLPINLHKKEINFIWSIGGSLLITWKKKKKNPTRQLRKDHSLKYLKSFYPQIKMLKYLPLWNIISEDLSITNTINFSILILIYLSQYDHHQPFPKNRSTDWVEWMPNTFKLTHLSYFIIMVWLCHKYRWKLDKI